MRVLAAMSGGVDSSVAAALLKSQGYDVVGVTMRLYDEGGRDGERGCCGLDGAREAARVAAKLGFPHYTWDFREEFRDRVIEDFCSEYGRGRTPNPCVRCNERLKFDQLLGRARELGAERVATGHHARIAAWDMNQSSSMGIAPQADPPRSWDWTPNHPWQLLRGVGASKDQSYFLYTMTQEQLASVLMPVGAYTKAEVRELARRFDLPVAERPESQDICFVSDGDYAGFLRRRRPEFFRPGPVLDTEGRVLGEHQGVGGFTLGQRKGLGLALGERRYVVRLDPERNVVVLGAEDEARARVVEAADARWVFGRPPREPFRAQASVRYQSDGGEALVEPKGKERVRATFDQPQWAPTPGQAIVFWQGEVVLGGATIGRE